MKGKFPAAVVIPYKKEIFSKICKKSTRFVGFISERTFAAPMSPGKSQTEIKNFPSSFWLKIPRRNVQEEKANQQEKVSFKTGDLRKFFPKSYSAAQMQETILKLLSEYQRKRQRSRDAR